MAEHTDAIRDAISLPVIVDADTSPCPGQGHVGDAGTRQEQGLEPNIGDDSGRESVGGTGYQQRLVRGNARREAIAEGGDWAGNTGTFILCSGHTVPFARIAAI
jgi:hypothetical protein